MPHIVIEANKSLIKYIDPKELVDNVHQAAMDTKLFDKSPGGVKVRLNTYKYWNNADEQSDFVNVFANIMEGRTDKQKEKLSRGITEAIHALCPDVEIISTQVIDIHKASYTNKEMVK